MDLKPISEQVVVIVGATSGIGRETALQMAKEGAKVVLSGRGQEELTELAGQIQASGGQAVAIAVEDAARFDEMHRLAQQAVDTYGRIDSWVHAAAVSMYARFEETMPEEFRRIIEVNLLGQIYGALAALPHIKREGRGALVHISSIESKMSMPYQAAYAASKHGIPGFLDSLRQELQREGVDISVTNVMPSSINTPFFDKALTRLGVKPQPYPPVYQPSVVAEAIIYAAQNPVQEVAVGGGGRGFQLIHKVAPALADRWMQATGSMQRSDMPKSPNAPHNLYTHLSGLDQSEGSYSEMARPFSIQTWLRTHPIVRNALMAGLVTGTVMVASRRRSRSRLEKAKDAVAALGEMKAVQMAGDTIGETIKDARRAKKRAARKIDRSADAAGKAFDHTLAQADESIERTLRRADRAVEHGLKKTDRAAERAMKKADRAYDRSVEKARRLPRQLDGLMVTRRRVGPVVLPGRIGPVRTPGRIGPVHFPEQVAGIHLPEAVAGRKIGPFALPRVFAARTRR